MNNTLRGSYGRVSQLNAHHGRGKSRITELLECGLGHNVDTCSKVTESLLEVAVVDRAADHRCLVSPPIDATNSHPRSSLGSCELLYIAGARCLPWWLPPSHITTLTLSRVDSGYPEIFHVSTAGVAAAS